MNRVASTCSWCHTSNDLVPGVKNICRHCHHRADLPRSDCDCFECLGIFSSSAESLATDDLLKWLRRDRGANAIACKGTRPPADDQIEPSPEEGGAP